MVCKPGDSICGCTLRQKCGAGAYGEVWLAEDAIGARVALKILYDRKNYSERELAGLKNYRDCNHPNLLKIRYVEIADDHIGYTMDAADDLNKGSGEYLPDTLANRLHKYGRMDGKEILAMLDGLLDGLEELHKRGLVHRDIKPDNILWVNGRPTLADAGLVALSGRGSLVGTPGFMSPKLLSGKGLPDPADDFYALGKVIYCALTGLPVGEYPSIPENMTISTNASLGYALRESCKLPVRSSSEFRKLLQGRSDGTERSGKTKAPRGTDRTKRRLSPRIKLCLFLILISALSAGGIRLYMMAEKTSEETSEKTSEKMTEKSPAHVPYVMTPEEQADLDAQLKETERRLAESQAEMRSKVQKATKRGDSYLKSVQEQTVKLLRDDGFIPEKKEMTGHLLQYRVMTWNEISDLLWYSDRDPRIQPIPEARPKTGRNLSVPETDLIRMFSVAYPEFDREKVLERQAFWRTRSDRRGMLETDPIMQALTLDAIIRHEVNGILKRKKFRKGQRTRLKTLFVLRRGLIWPEAGEPDLSAWPCFKD